MTELPVEDEKDEKVDLKAECSSDKIESGKTLYQLINRISKKWITKFFFPLDEWTEVIRRKSNSSDIKLNRQKVNHDASRVNGWTKAGHHSR